MKTLETTFFNGTQSVEFNGIYEYKGHKLRITIDIDSYDMQSSARIKIFNPTDLAWNFLASIPYSLMASVKNEAVFSSRKVDSEGGGLRMHERAAIESDINTFLNKAKTIL